MGSQNFTKFLLGLALMLVSVVTWSQVSGVITDGESGEPLIGANVLIKGTSNGTVTDFDGNFSLDANQGDVLVVSYIGYATQEITVNGSTINVQLAEGQSLDEVVVVGYGTVKKRDITGSVASLKEEDFNKGLVLNSDQLLQGRVAGVNITNNSGQPGGQATVKIRGNNSIRAGADPLYVLDGIPLDGRTAKASISSGSFGDVANSNPLNFLNPSDIASMEVLKDASAAAIYGSRASNGVILITTKKARSGDPVINFNAGWGSSSILKKYDVLSGDEYRSALSSYGIGGDGGASEDAFSSILQRGFTQNYNLSIGTGGEKYKLRFSGGYQDVDGIIKESGLKRYSGVLNSQFDLVDDLVGMDVFMVASNTDENVAPISTNAGFRGNLVGQALQWNPTIPLMTGSEFTTYKNNSLVGSTTINPLHFLNAYDENSSTTTILGSISPYINFTESLQYRYRYGINYGAGQARSYLTKDLNLEGIENEGWAGISNTRLVTTLHQHTLNWTSDVSSNLSLNLLLGYEYQKFDWKFDYMTGRGFDDTPAGFDLTNILQNGDNSNRAIGSYADPLNELQSFFGRAIFGIGDRLDITATVRADGSTKFGENNKYGIFPSFAAAYGIFEDGQNSFFNNLKIRAGWGQTGNQEFPAGSSKDLYAYNDNGGISRTNVGNPDLKWETSSTFNIGLDFAIIDYRLSGTFDYYNRTTKDLLLDPQLQEPGPPIRAWKNLDANLVNSGFEFGLNGFLIQKQNWDLNLGLNLSFLKNELTNYDGADILTGNLYGQGSSGAFVQKHVSGHPLNTFFLRDFTGLDDSGNSVYSNDGEPILTDKDPNAKTILGMSLGFNFDKLSFGMNWNGAYGHYLYNNTAMSVIPIGNLGSRNIDANLIGGSVKESIANPIASSTRYLEKGNFTKLSNATLSYNFGDLGRFKGLQISLTGQNLLLFTNYNGFDPEVNTVNLRNGVPSAGIEYIPYPSSRTFIFGINTSF